MATLIDYKGLQVISPDPVGDGGLAIQNDLKELADRLAASRYLTGLDLSVAGASAVRVGTGAALSADGSMNLAAAAPLTANLNVGGPNGLDRPPKTPGRVYYLFAIGDSSETRPVAGLLSLDPGAPLLPPGYDRLRRIGFVVHNASSRVLRFHGGVGLTPRVHFAEDESELQVLADGGATAFTAVDCRRVAPSTARTLLLHARIRNTTAGGTATSTQAAAFLRAGGDQHDGSLYAVRPGLPTRSGIGFQIELPCSAAQRIEYRVSSSGVRLTLSVVGVEDRL